MPVFNEKGTFLEILDKVLKADIGEVEKEIIVVDDFSSDGTREILIKLKKKKVRVFFHSSNKGKGSALRTALKHSSGDLIVIQDADLEYDPRDFKKLIQPIINGKSKVVYGSRFLEENNKIYNRYYFGNKILSFITSILYVKKITDMETCYKVFDSRFIKKIKFNAKGFEFEPEITSKILRRREKIIEIPISYFPRRKDQGKKIKPRDGLIAFFTLLRYRFFNSC